MRAMKTLLKIFILLLSMNCYAAIYKWKDADGQMHYSTMPPDNINAEKVKVSVPQPASVPQQQPVAAGNKEPAQNQTDKRAMDQHAKENDKQTDAAAAQEQAKIAEEEAKLKAINCAKAKAHLTAIQAKPRMSVQEGDQQRMLGSEELDAEIKITQDHIKRYCVEGK